MWNEKIELGNYQEDIVDGEPIDSYIFREVFADKKSVKRSEYYQAANTDLKPELIFVVHSFEYDELNDRIVRYPTGESGKQYNIIRDYEINEDEIEITLTSRLGGDS